MTPQPTARALIASAQRILLLTHVSPDGDAMGSLLGLHWALKACGKETLPVSADGCPDTFRFLPGSAEVANRAKEPFDLVITLDCADLGRAGKPAEALGQPPDINIDHHATNPGFGRLNFVTPEAASTAEIIFDLLPQFGLPLTGPAAECLLCGVVSDTLGFRTSNTTAKVLTTAQKLMAAGADLPRIYDHALNRRSFNAVQLWGQALARATLSDGLAWTTIPLSIKQAVGYNGKGDADLINVLTTINEADVFLIFVEHEKDEVKVSWRARPGWDVAKIAQSFGGGGHVSAAGANLKNISLAEAEEKVLAATRKIMSNAK
ncbi:MAG: bifunctional oligoribonuclease/PAP phosphatase NrnA [Chloroflexi bacterium]|nr:bifunctional oligoribonuclease/PAP phosphatase NrnA [Chloroflexota bacterium]